jgi:hypothetical protein
MRTHSSTPDRSKAPGSQIQATRSHSPYFPHNGAVAGQKDAFRLQASEKKGNNDPFLLPFPVFSTIEESVAGGGEHLPSSKHRLPLPQERVCLKTSFEGFRPGETAVGGFPTKGI